MALALAGCAHAPPVPNGAPPAEPAPSFGVEPLDLGTQQLFRVRYDGPLGSGGFRLILSLERRDRYRVAAKDRFGRGVWRLDVSGRSSLIVDDRSKRYCRSEEGVRIPELALEALPLEGLPAVLHGRLPEDLTPATEPGEFLDSHGRRWTVRGSATEPDGWTVWEEGEPWLWWQRLEAGAGVLSHRGGSQWNWRLIAREPLASDLDDLVLESSYRWVGCDRWQTDSASEGGEPGAASR